MNDPPGPASGPPHRPGVPPDRYGRPAARPPRRLLIAAASLVALAMAAGAWWGGQAYSRRTLGEMLSYQTSDGGVQIAFLVQRDPARTTECALRARNRAGEEVGRRILTIPPGEEREVRMSEFLATRERPITGEIKECRSVGDG